MAVDCRTTKRSYKVWSGKCFVTSVSRRQAVRPVPAVPVCAARELEEETGFRAGSLEHLVDVHTAAAYTSEKIAVYVAKDLIPSRQHLDEDEFVDIRRYTFEELNDMIFSGKITDSKTIAAVMAYQTKQRK